MTARTNGWVTFADDVIVLDFPYDRDQVEEVKRIPGAKWDKGNRVWRAPASSLNEVRVFARKHGLGLDSELEMFDVPKHPLTRTHGVKVVDDSIHVYIEYDTVKIKLLKKIPGAAWDAATKSWKAPMSSVTQIINWAARFGLEVEEELLSIAAEEQSRMDAMRERSKWTDADFVVKSLVGEPFPYQRAGMAYCMSALQQTKFRKGVILGDQPGLGKTVQSLGVVEAANAYPAVVVCPATLKLNWQKEANRWLPHRSTQVLAGKQTHDINAEIVIVNYDVLTGWVDKFRGFKSVIFDESHYCKNKAAARTKAAIKLAKRVVDRDAVRLCLSGTPITNRPAELATQLDIVGRINDFGGYMGYYRTYCDAFKDKWGHWHISGASNLDVLHDRLRANCYVRRTKDQVLPDLPNVLHSPVSVEMSPAGRKEYDKAYEDIVDYLVERAKQIALELGQSPRSAAVRAKMAAEANTHLVRLSVLRRLSAKAKMPAAVEWVEARLEAGSKVVIAAHHRDVVDELAQRFGGLKIQGQMSVEEVEQAKRKFQELPVEEAPVIVLSMQAAKTGHTLTAAQDILFLELPWTPADVDQTYGRLHRIGQKGSVNATYMLASRSVDEQIYDLIAQKREVVDAATDGIVSTGVDMSVGAALIDALTQQALAL